ncbi:MAG: hypothetical protein ACTSV2_07180, partial [Candidatus Thorarchaeota archaeon]
KHLFSGVYEVTVTVSDEYGNTLSGIITITVEQSTTSETTIPTQTTAPTVVPNDFTAMVLILAMGGTLGIVIVIIIIRSPLSRRLKK